MIKQWFMHEIFFLYGFSAVINFRGSLRSKEIVIYICPTKWVPEVLCMVFGSANFVVLLHVSTIN